MFDTRHTWNQSLSIPPLQRSLGSRVDPSSHWQRETDRSQALLPPQKLQPLQFAPVHVRSWPWKYRISKKMKPAPFARPEKWTLPWRKMISSRGLYQQYITIFVDARPMALDHKASCGARARQPCNAQ